MWFGIGGNGVSAAPLTSCAQSVGGCKDAQKDDVQVKSAKGQELWAGQILEASIGGGQVVNWLKTRPEGPMPALKLGPSNPTIKTLILLPVKGQCK